MRFRTIKIGILLVIGTLCLALQGYAQPTAVLTPSYYNITLANCDDSTTSTLNVSNTGSSDLNFRLDGGGPDNLSLETVLSTLSQNYQVFLNEIPNSVDFFDDYSYYIADGYDDMYDYGNYLHSNYYSYIPYSDNFVTRDTVFGDTSGYFTWRIPEAFVMVADLDNVAWFEIAGELGADGSGNVDGTVLDLQMFGKSYKGFVKRVYNAGDPSVNHLIIVEDNGSMDHFYSTNTDDDQHRVFNLTGSTRIYYLLFNEVSGGYYDDLKMLSVMRKFLKSLDPLPNWIYLPVTSDTVSSGNSTNITIGFNGLDLISGVYAGNMVVSSNDPVNPTINVPCTLNIVGAPRIIMSDTCLWFGSIMEYTSTKDTLYIANAECDTLNVTNITTSSSQFTVNLTNLVIPPLDSQFVVVTFAPTAVGNYNATLTIFNNDNDTTICLNGTAFAKPNISVNPDSFSVSFASCVDSVTYALTITNLGDGDLNFVIDGEGSSPVAASCLPATTGYCCSRGIYNVQFSTIDNSTLNGIEGYQDYSSVSSTIVRPGDKQYLSIQTGPFSNENVRAWIDFNNNGLFEGNEKVFESLNNFQFHGDSIFIPYSAARGVALRMRIGSDYFNNAVPSACGSVQYGQYEDYSVIIMDITKIRDTLAYGESVTINLEFSSNNILAGEYSTELAIKSNDPLNPQLLVPLNMTIQGSEGISLSDTCLFMDTVMQNASTSGILYVTNPGCDTLFLYNVVPSLSVFTVDTNYHVILPWDTAEVAVTFKPTAVATYYGTLDLLSSLGTKTICLKGTGINAPEISVDPGFFSVKINSCEDSVDYVLNIYNIGASDLYIDVDGSTFGGGQMATPSCTPVTTGTCCSMGIYNVTFNTINNTTPNATEGYQDFTSTILTQVIQSENYSISVETGTSYNEHVSVWMDFNNDGDFDDSGELVFSTINQDQFHTGNIMIPASAVRGIEFRMRVGSEYYGLSQPQPCNNVTYGQFEDYAIIINNGIKIPEIVDTVFAGDSTIITIKFNSKDLNSLAYISQVNINTNDPLNPQVIVPCTLVVDGVPGIQVSDPCFDFGSVMEESEKRDSLTILNTGCDTLFISSLNNALTVFKKTIRIERRINESYRDAEEDSSSGNMDLTSSDLELGYEFSPQLVGMNFGELAIPNGAVITNAYIQFVADENSTGSANVNIFGNAANNASSFTTTSYDLSSRAKTTASVAWPDLQQWFIDYNYKSPDIKSVIQEIVDRPGWNDGNDLVVFIDGNGTRTAESYNGEAQSAPILVVEYTPTSFFVLPNEEAVIQIDFSPTSTGVFNDTLVITNNVVEQKICLKGQGYAKPVINVDPASLFSTIASCDDSVSKTVVVKNTGLGVLQYDLLEDLAQYDSTSLIYYTTAGEATYHNFYGLSQSDSFHLTITLNGDFSTSSEYANLYIDNTYILRIDDGDVADGTNIVRSYSFGGTSVKNWLTDGKLEIRVDNSGSVGTGFSDLHQVQLQVDPLKWLTASVVVDTISTSDSTVITFEFKSEGLVNGTYYRDVNIRSNDPLNPIVILPCTLVVSGTPKIALGQNCINFDTITALTVVKDTLIIYNLGCDTLNVTNITTLTSLFAVDTTNGKIAPFDTGWVVVTFAPTTAGTFVDTITIINNDVNQEVCLLGVATPPAVISFSDNSLTATINVCGDSITQSLTIYNTGSGVLNFSSYNGGFSSGSALPYAYVANRYDDNISVISLNTNEVVGNPITVGDYPYRLAITPNGRKLYVTNRNSDNVSVINTATNSVTATFSIGNGPSSVAFTPDGKYAYITNMYDDNVQVVDVNTNSIITTITQGIDYPRDVEVTPDGKYVYVANGNTNVVIIEAATNTVVTNLGSTGYGANTIAITPDGKYVYVSQEYNYDVMVIDNATKSILTYITLPGWGNPLGLDITPDGNYIYAVNRYTNSMAIIEVATNSIASNIYDSRLDYVYDVTIPASGKYAYVTNDNNDQCMIIDLLTNIVVDALTVGNGPYGITSMSSGVPWVSESPESGSVGANDSMIVSVTFNSQNLISGIYTGNIYVQSNDPLSELDTITCTLTLNGYPVINLSQNCFYLDSIMEYSKSIDTLVINNAGCDTLKITNISTSNSVFYASDTVLQLLPGDSALIAITFYPTSTGNFSDTLTIVNNDVIKKVCLSGKAYNKPAISIYPDSFAVSITGCNDSLILPLKIYNSGLGKLNYLLNKTMTGNGIIKPASCTPITTGTCCSMGIYQVTFNTIDYTTNNGTDGYQDYSATQSTTLVPGETYSIYVRTGTSYNEHVTVWIDYDNSGSFEVAEEVFSTNNTYVNHNGFVTIPNTIVSGTPLRMRVGSDYYGNSPPQPCTNVQYGQFEDYAVLIPGGVTVLDSAGTVTTSDSATVSIKFQSTDLLTGVYSSNIIITSNDPLYPTLTVPAVLTVIGKPEISLSVSCLAMDSIVELTADADTFTISNNGCDTLFVSAITNNLSIYSVNNSVFAVPPAGSESVIVNFAPTSAGTYYDTLSISSNDQTKTICLSGTALPKAVISVNPTSFNETIASCDDSISRTITVYNSGVGNLIYTAIGTNSSPAAPACKPTTWGYCCSMGIYNVQFNTINYSSGNGSESYQDYSSSISTEVKGGETYSVYVQTGASYDESVVIWIDYDNSGSFEASEKVFESISERINHNGFITIPITAVTGLGLRMRVASDYEFEPVPVNCADVRYGQVEDYSIVLSDGLEIIAKTDTVASSDSSTVSIKFKSKGLNNGTYYSQVAFSSNDPVNSTVLVPCTLVIAGNPLLSLSDNCLDLDSIMEYTTHTDTLTFTNTGCDTLIITDISNSVSYFTFGDTALSILPGESEMVIITFAPTAVGTFNDTLTIIGNVTTQTVCLVGKSYAKPSITVIPAFLTKTIAACDDSITNTLKVINNGTGNLIFNLLENSGYRKMLSLDGSGDYIDVSDNNEMDITNAVTMETWLYVNSIQETWTCIIGKPGRNYTMWLNSSGYIHISYYNTSFSNIGLNTSSGTILTGQWYHVAAVFNWDSGSMKIYLNGVLEASGSTNLLPQTSTYDFRMSNNLDGGSGNYLNGKLDEVRLWKAERTQAEIQQYMNSSLYNRFNDLVGYWNFNGSNGANDQSGNGYNGVAFGNAAFVSSDAPIKSFVDVTSVADTVLSGDTANVTIKFKSIGYPTGSYYTVVDVNSNDPLNPVVGVPCSLTVVGAPIITLSDTCLLFDTVMQFTTLNKVLTISNTGCDTLLVTDINKTLSVYTLSDTSFTILPGNNAMVTVTFSPTSSGLLADSLVISSNDGNKTICLNGIGAGSPDIVIEPTSYNVTLNTCNDSITQNLKVKNTGTGILYINAQDNQYTGRAVEFNNSNDNMYVPYIPLNSYSSYTIDAWVKFPLAVTGGYRALVVYSSNRYHITVNSAGEIGVYYYGFYSSGYNVDALADGWHFISAVASAGQTQFYVDGNLVGTSSYYLNYAVYYIGNYSSNNEQFGTVDELRFWNYARSSAEINSSMPNRLDGNETGLLAYYNYDNNTANDLSGNGENGSLNGTATITNDNFQQPFYASLSTNIDTVAIGDSILLPIQFNAKGYRSGTYIDSIIITTNDPLIPKVLVPCTLTVNGYANIVLSDSCMVMDTTMELTPLVDTLTVYNKGCDDLVISNITNLSSPYSVSGTSFTITAGDSAKVYITFSPISTGLFKDTLTIVNNDVNLSVCLSGYGIGKSVIAVVPSSLNFSVTACTDSVTKPITIFNTGQSDLTWSAQTPNGAGNALDFDGGSDYVSIGSTALNSISTALTVEGWIYMRSSTSYEYILSNDRDCCGSYRGYSLRITGGVPQFQIWDNTFTQRAVNSSASIGINEWHHIAGTFDGTTLKIYVDGILMNSSSFTGVIGTPSTYNLYLGGMGYWASNYNVNGILDEIRIWNIARSESEIRSFMGVPLLGNESGLMAYWDFNEGSGSSVGDVTGNGYNGTVSGAAWVTSSANLINAVADSSSGSIPAGDSATIGIKFYTSNLESVTFNANVYINSNDPITPQVTIPCTLIVDVPPAVPSASDTTICFGNPTPTLTSTGSNVKWYSDPALDTLLASASTYTSVETAVGTYFYYVTQTVNGCESQNDSSVLIINSGPAAPIVSDSTICYGDPIAIFTASGTSISWYSNASLSNLISTGGSLTPPDSTVGTHTYYVTDSVANCPASSSDTLIYTIKSDPAAPAASDTVICFENPTPTISATGTGVKWYDDVGLTIQLDTGNSYKPIADTNGAVYDYYITQTVNSCESQATKVTLTVNTVPIVPVSSNKAVCYGDLVPNLTSSGSYLQWYSDTGLTTKVNTGNTFVTGKVDSGIYTYYVTDSIWACPQSLPDTVTLTIKKIPAPPLVADTTVCYGDPTPNLTAVGSGLRWFTNPGLTALANSGNPFITGLTEAGVYTYYVIQNVNGCVSSSITQTLTISLPAKPVAIDTTISMGQTTPDLTAVGSSIKWYADSALDTLLKSGSPYATGKTDSGTYLYYVTQTVNGCQSLADSQTLTILPVSAPIVSGATICFGMSTPIFTATGSNVKWYADSSLLTQLDTGNTYTPAETAVDTHDYFVTQTLFGIESIATKVELVINAVPAKPSVADEEICKGEAPAVFSYSGSYVKWYSASNPNVSLKTGTTYISPEINVGTYTYYVLDSGAYCSIVSVRDTFIYTIKVKPSPPATQDTVVCKGLPNPPLKALNGTEIKWYKNAGLTIQLDTGSTYVASDTGTGSHGYYVTQTSDGCRSNASTALLTINPGTYPPNIADDNKQVCEGASMPTFFAPGVNIRWYRDYNGTDEVGQNANFVPVDTLLDTDYTYYVTDQSGGCAESSPDSVLFRINSNPLPPVVDTAVYSICKGGAIPNLSATGTNVKWYYDDAAKMNAPDTGNTIKAKSDSGIHYYYVTQTVNDCESAFDTVTLNIIDVTPKPTGQDIAMCKGDSIPTLTASGGSGAVILWHANDSLSTVIKTGTSYKPTDTIAGIHSYYVIQVLGGCTSSYIVIKLQVDTILLLPNVTDSSLSICVGQANPQFAATGSNILWFSNSTLTDTIGGGANYTPVDASVNNYTYYVAQSNSGCIGTPDSVNFTINSIPLAPVADDTTTICFGSPTPTLTASGTNIEWFSDAGLLNQVDTGATFTPTDTAVGTKPYYLTQTVTSTGCTSPSASVNLTINPPPDMPVVLDTTACVSSIPPLVYNGTIVRWYSDSLLTDSLHSGSSFISSDTAIGPHTYYVTDSVVGCAASAVGSVTLTLEGAPGIPTVSNDTVMCEGSPVPPLVASGTNIEWYKDSLLSISASSGGTFITTDTTDGIYTYYVTQSSAGNGCASKAASVTLTVFIQPSAPVAPDVAVCDNDTVPDLTASGTNVEWYKDPALDTLLVPGSSYSTGKTASGAYDYYVIQNVGGCQSAIDTVTLTISTSPSAPSGSIDTICQGETVPALSTSGLNVSWFEDVGLDTFLITASNYTPTVSGEGTYTYYLVDSVLGCNSSIGTATLVINVGTPPSVSNEGICFGSPTPTLTATGSNVKWYDTITLDSLITTGTTYTPNETDINVYVYYVTDSSSVSGCVSNPVSISLIISSSTSPPVVSNTTICDGDSVPPLFVAGTNIRWFSDSALTNQVHDEPTFYTGDSG
ncbi:DUF1573 domain-containing protein, partial [bacterium AH-315-C07]|nr:DUF1573 domain-containing protein [bacterium AH-315-C07]